MKKIGIIGGVAWLSMVDYYAETVVGKTNFPLSPTTNPNLHTVSGANA
jgi:aspartate/glutamate racemase